MHANFNKFTGNFCSTFQYFSQNYYRGIVERYPCCSISCFESFQSHSLNFKVQKSFEIFYEDHCQATLITFYFCQANLQSEPWHFSCYIIVIKYLICKDGCWFYFRKKLKSSKDNSINMADALISTKLSCFHYMCLTYCCLTIVSRLYFPLASHHFAESRSSYSPNRMWTWLNFWYNLIKKPIYFFCCNILVENIVLLDDDL